MDRAVENGLEDSLFEGMDFVLHTEEEKHVQATPQELDEDLFSGLSMSSVVIAAAPETQVLDLTVKEAEAETSYAKKPMDAAQINFDSIMAAYDERLKPAVHVAPTNSTFRTSSGRKKKKSVRIGYGRNNEDYVEDAVEKTPSEADTGKSPAESIDVEDFEAILHEKDGDLVADGNSESRVSVSTSEVSQADFETFPVLENRKSVDEDAAETTEVAEESVETITEDGSAGKEDAVKINAVEGPEEELSSMDMIMAEPTLNIEQKLQAVKQFSEKKLKDLEARAGVASKARKATAQLRRQAAEKLSAATAKRKKLEAELDSACEKEDFELADKLSEEVAEAQNLLEAMEMLFKEADLNYDSAASSVEEIIKLQMAAEEEASAALMSLLQEADAAAAKLQGEADEAAKGELQELDIQEEELATKRTQHSIQSREIEEAEAELEKLIANSIQPELHEKDAFLAERNMLAEELRQLLEKVKAKEAEIADRDRQIQAIDERIASVVEQFQGDKERIMNDTKSAISVVERLEEESLRLQELRKEIEERLAGAEVKSQSLKYIAASAADEAAALQIALEKKRRVAQSAKDIKEKKAILVKEEEELLAEAQVLKQEASAARASLQELSSTKIRFQQEITTAKQKIAYLEKRGPELDAEKRLAAAARNFKEAARLSGEAKALLAEKEASVGELQKSSSQLQKLEEDVKAKILALADIEGLISLKEKHAARTCCVRLRLVAAAARDERDVAVGLEDFEEAASLQAEADAADGEADELQRIHQFEDLQFQNLHPDDPVETPLED